MNFSNKKTKTKLYIKYRHYLEKVYQFLSLCFYFEVIVINLYISVILITESTISSITRRATSLEKKRRQCPFLRRVGGSATYTIISRFFPPRDLYLLSVRRERTSVKSTHPTQVFWFFEAQGRACATRARARNPRSSSLQPPSSSSSSSFAARTLLISPRVVCVYL